jgi:hypothetical protein
VPKKRNNIREAQDMWSRSSAAPDSVTSVSCPPSDDGDGSGSRFPLRSMLPRFDVADRLGFTASRATGVHRISGLSGQESEDSGVVNEVACCKIMTNWRKRWGRRSTASCPCSSPTSHGSQRVRDYRVIKAFGGAQETNGRGGIENGRRNGGHA